MLLDYVTVGIAALLISASLALAFFLMRWINAAYAAGADVDLLPWINAVRRTCDQIDIKPRDLPVEILPHLLLSDKRTANDPSLLDAFGVTHLLNVAGRSGITDKMYIRGDDNYLIISAEDEEGYAILPKHFHEALGFINQARESGGRCLIHCMAGINRSGVIAIAALMVSERLDVLEAVRRGKAARGIILTNHSFQAQLVELARQHELLGPLPEPEMAAPVAPAKDARKPAKEALKGLF